MLKGGRLFPRCRLASVVLKEGVVSFFSSFVGSPFFVYLQEGPLDF